MKNELQLDPLTEKILDMAIDETFNNFRIDDDLVKARENIKLLFFVSPNVEHIKTVLETKHVKSMPKA